MFRVNAYVVAISTPSYIPSSISSSLLLCVAVALVVLLREISVLIRNYNLLIINDITRPAIFLSWSSINKTLTELSRKYMTL